MERKEMSGTEILDFLRYSRAEPGYDLTQRLLYIIATILFQMWMDARQRDSKFLDVRIFHDTDWSHLED